MLIAAVIAAHGRCGEFYMLSKQLWKNLGYYIGIAILGAVILLAPPGYPTTICTTAFFLFFLAPTIYGAISALMKPQKSLFARQPKRYEMSLPKPKRQELHSRPKRNIGVTWDNFRCQRDARLGWDG